MEQLEGIVVGGDNQIEMLMGVLIPVAGAELGGEARVSRRVEKIHPGLHFKGRGIQLTLDAAQLPVRPFDAGPIGVEDENSLGCGGRGSGGCSREEQSQYCQDL